jgi:hypothetical protein
MLTSCVRQGIALALGSGLLLALAAGAPAAEKTGSLTGKVTLNGKPLAKGKVSFHPAKGKAVTADVQDGSYSAKGVPVGKLRVTVEGKDVPKKFSSPDTSGLVAEVTEGVTTLDINLKVRKND